MRGFKYSHPVQIHVVYRIVGAVGVGGEEWVGEGERVWRGEAHEQRVVESGFVVIQVDALELLQLLAHVHAARDGDVEGNIVIFIIKYCLHVETTEYFFASISVIL